MKKILLFSRIFYIFALFSGACFISNAHATSPATAVSNIEGAVTVEQKGVESGDKWLQDEIKLVQEIQQSRIQYEWYAMHADALQRYISKIEKNIAELNTQKSEFERIEMSLESNLVEVVENLESFVQGDLPFLQDERAKRIAFLHDTLDDYTISLAEKLRRVCEALQTEYNYAQNIEITRESIDTPSGSHTADCIRVGRMAIFALAADGSAAWQYTKNGYTDMEVHYIPELQKMMQKNISSLSILPIQEFK